jgi:hypothetical protein
VPRRGWGHRGPADLGERDRPGGVASDGTHDVALLGAAGAIMGSAAAETLVVAGADLAHDHGVHDSGSVHDDILAARPKRPRCAP